MSLGKLSTLCRNLGRSALPFATESATALAEVHRLGLIVKDLHDMPGKAILSHQTLLLIAPLEAAGIDDAEFLVDFIAGRFGHHGRRRTSRRSS